VRYVPLTSKDAQLHWTDRHILPTKCYLQCASQGAVSVHKIYLTVDAKLWGLWTMWILVLPSIEACVCFRVNIVAASICNCVALFPVPTALTMISYHNVIGFGIG
jgi:hypothetical protein